MGLFFGEWLVFDFVQEVFGQDKFVGGYVFVGVGDYCWLVQCLVVQGRQGVLMGWGLQVVVYFCVEEQWFQIWCGYGQDGLGVKEGGLFFVGNLLMVVVVCVDQGVGSV